ncbi:hypothetical protein AO377_1899 [Moraxella catarrhalis]|nr:hypothetical protein AO377_1899 [Moraxella catarrhalis]OAV19239.1 hypothetical protein AO375_0042 [Moraxella catarrhalis]
MSCVFVAITIIFIGFWQFLAYNKNLLRDECKLTLLSSLIQ